jgi:hypothetical protein
MKIDVSHNVTPYGKVGVYLRYSETHCLFFIGVDFTPWRWRRQVHECLNIQATVSQIHNSLLHPRTVFVFVYLARRIYIYVVIVSRVIQLRDRQSVNWSTPAVAETSRGAHPSSYPTGTKTFFGYKEMGREAEHRRQSYTEV